MPKNVSIQELKDKAVELRVHIAETTFAASAGHVGGSLSCSDLLVALYFKHLNYDAKNPSKEDRDRFIMSKGHCALAYVPCLGMAGFIDINEVKANFNKTHSAYGMHPDSKKIPGCDASTGSLGHGLPIGVGMCLGNKMKNIDAKVVVMTGDGECQEGSNWEAAMSASHYNLNNLIWIIDRNRMEIDGPTESVLGLNPLDEKVKAFGFDVIECNGHDMADIDRALTEAWANTSKPVCIIANTIKGYSIAQFEDKASCHYCSFGDDEKAFKAYVQEIRNKG